MAYAKRIIKDGKHYAHRPGRGMDIELPDELTTEIVVQALNRSFDHGAAAIRNGIRDLLDITDCDHG